MFNGKREDTLPIVGRTSLGRFVRNLRTLMAGRCPGQLIVQYTDRCNATCPQCGMRKTETFQRSKLPMDDAKKTIDAAAARGVESLSITGGEPLLYQDEVIELLGHALRAGIRYTRTGTNGFLFVNHNRPGFEKDISNLADQLREAGIYNFWISIDSADPDVHEDMRGLKDVWSGIRKAVPIFHRHGIYPSANLGINRRTGGKPCLSSSYATLYDEFRDAFDRFYSSVIDLGFTIVNSCYPMDGSHNDPVYRAAANDDIVTFTPDQRSSVYRALFDTIGSYRGKIRIFTPMSSLYALIGQHTTGHPKGSYPCRGGIDYFFVSAADGNTYPCGYRGSENLGKLWELPVAGDSSTECTKCDWECFRDPSELIGPLTAISTKPLKLLKDWMGDTKAFRTWVTDLRYYYACDFFNGRLAPDYGKLSKHACEAALLGEGYSGGGVAAGRKG